MRRRSLSIIRKGRSRSDSFDKGRLSSKAEKGEEKDQSSARGGGEHFPDLFPEKEAYRLQS